MVVLLPRSAVLLTMRKEQIEWSNLQYHNGNGLLHWTRLLKTTYLTVSLELIVIAHSSLLHNFPVVSSNCTPRTWILKPSARPVERGANPTPAIEQSNDLLENCIQLMILPVTIHPKGSFKSSMKNTLLLVFKVTVWASSGRSTQLCESVSTSPLSSNSPCFGCMKRTFLWRINRSPVITLERTRETVIDSLIIVS